MQLTYSYDESADAVYVYFTRQEVERTEELSDSVAVDYDRDGEPVGVEFLGVSEGIDLDDVPRAEDIARLLEGHNFKIYA
jgi:uncharacterized protein YuzE